MARIAGVDLPRDKRIEIALTYIFGIGLTTSKKLLAAADVNPDTRTRDLTSADRTRRTMRARARARRRPSQARKSKGGS